MPNQHHKLALEDPALLRTSSYIAGAWEAGNGREALAVRDPATGAMVAEVAKADAADTRRAIDAAHAAFKQWRRTTAKERSAVLRRWYELMLDAAEDLAALMTAEQGKTLVEARGEIQYGASFLEWFSEQAKRADGNVFPGATPHTRAICIRQPVGVVAAITPWNFPNAMIARKAAPALAAGCTIVVKPAEDTPLSALAMAELAERAGFPPGCFNVVVGDPKEIGAELTGSPLVRKLSFTGSTKVGKLLEEQCAATLKRTTMELGGNAPFIVFDDAGLGRRGGRRAGIKVPKQRSDLRLRESLSDPGQHLRRVLRTPGGRIEQAGAGQRRRGRRDPGAVDQYPGNREGLRSGRSVHQSGRQMRNGRPARRSRWVLLSPHDPARSHPGHARFPATRSSARWQR